MSAWLWLAALAVLLVGLLAAALSSPLQLKVFAAYPAQPPVQVDVRWLYGLVDLRGYRPGGDDAEVEHAEGGEPEPDEEEDDGLGRVEAALDTGVDYLETRSDLERKARVALAVLRTEDFTLVVTRLLRDLVHAVRVERVGLQAGFGFGSPAETGKVFGQLKAAFAWTHATDRIHVDIQPDFHSVGFEGGADVQLEARTWQLLRPLVVFGLAPPTLHAVKNARRAARG